MAGEGQPRQLGEQEYSFKIIELFKTEPLGTGSYGAVCKAKCDELICAAKLLYPVLFEIQPQTPKPGKEHRQPFHRFELECRFLSRINHPNIVQYLGTYRDPDTNAPVLLMELMDESLTRFLESSPGSIPYHIQVNLSNDIVQALAFLHSNGIIHRDLSSNNVLLLGNRAKVTDFGMSRFADVAATHLATMTVCPGTLAFMSPEALNEPPVYTEKLDNFSLGVVIVQVVTKRYPELTDRFRAMQVVDPHYPTRTFRAQVPVPEAERRHAHISLIDPTHPLLPIALHCLKDEDVERPSSQQLCQTLGALKETAMYQESSQQDKDQILRAKDEQILTQTQELGSKAQQLQFQGEQLQAEINAKETVNHDLAARLEQLTRDNLVLQNEAEAKERQLRKLNQQVESNEEIVAALQEAITQKEREMSELQGVLSSKDDQAGGTDQKLQTSEQRVNVVWETLPDPESMSLYSSSAVVGNKAYFSSKYEHTVYEYNYQTHQMCTIAKNPNGHFTMVTIYGMLTSVGGSDYGWFRTTHSNKLYSLIDRKWVEHFPPMPTKRGSPVVVYTNNILVVAGGMAEKSLNTTVEILATEMRQWSTVSPLPFSVFDVSATVYEDHVYISDDGIIRSSLLKCSLTSLIQSKPETSIWETIDPPVFASTLATVNGHLLAIGGKETGLGLYKTKNVHRYNPATNLWEVISQMSVARCDCLTAVLPGNKLLVVGGCLVRDKFEIATLN